MSHLLDVLAAHEETVSRVFAHELGQADCPRLLGAQNGGAQAMLAALRACCTEGDQRRARAWAQALHHEAASSGLSVLEVFTGLRCLERVVRAHLAKLVDEKTALLTGLIQLSDAVDLLRQCYVANDPVAHRGQTQLAEEFVALVSSADVFICLASLHGKPFYLNPAGRRLIGLGANEAALPANLHGFYSDESWQQLRDVAVPVVEETGQWEGQSQLRNHETGELLSVLTTMVLVKRTHTGKPSCLAIIHHDASDQIRLEEALAESNARKHSILESALDPIITIDQNGVITEFNRAAELTFGYSRGKVLGTQPSEVLFPPSKSAGHQNRIDRYLGAGEGSLLGRRIEVTAVRASGETFPAEMAMTFSQEQGAPVLTFFVRDIGQQKKAERDQARYAAELERSNRELEQFAYVASHDLQEPLRKIRTFSDRLEMQSGSLLDDVGRQCIQRMQSAAGRMQILIEALLTLSRVTTRGQHFVSVDLARVTREVVSDLEVKIEQVGGQVEVGDLPRIEADPVQMRQLLQNLIGNALKFHRVAAPPVVKVYGRLLQGRSQHHDGHSHNDELCRVTVQDNGIGFEEKHLDRVFEIFQRLHPRDVYEGTGIGLPICRKIVERHGGRIIAHSTPGQGSVFQVTLPVKHPKREAS